MRDAGPRFQADQLIAGLHRQPELLDTHARSLVPEVPFLICPRPIAGRRLLLSAVSVKVRPKGHVMAELEPSVKIPSPGEIARVRQRTYLVEGMVPPERAQHSTLVRMSCVDDDARVSRWKCSGKRK